MKTLILMTLCLFSMTVLGQDTELNALDKFSVHWGWVVGALFAGFEYVLANTDKVKANSSIDMVINFIKAFLKIK